LPLVATAAFQNRSRPGALTGAADRPAAGFPNARGREALKDSPKIPLL
jgi:hypothetical protein